MIAFILKFLIENCLLSKSHEYGKSFRQSIDVYSHLASPAIMATPLSSSRAATPFLSPHPLVSSFRKRTPVMGTRESEQPLLADQKRPVPTVSTAHVPGKITHGVGKAVSESDEMLSAGTELYSEPTGSSPLQALFNGWILCRFSIIPRFTAFS